MTSRVSFPKLIIETLRRHLAAVLITVLAFFVHIISFFLNEQNILSQAYVQYEEDRELKQLLRKVNN